MLTRPTECVAAGRAGKRSRARPGDTAPCWSGRPHGDSLQICTFVDSRDSRGSSRLQAPYVTSANEGPPGYIGAVDFLIGAYIQGDFSVFSKLFEVRLELLWLIPDLLDPASHLRMCFWWTRHVTRALELVWGRFSMGVISRDGWVVLEI